MAFSAVAALVAVAGAVYSADQQRQSAKEQAKQQAEAAELTRKQAAETARANALAAQTGAERERVQTIAKANAELASAKEAPDVELATQAPTEVARRRTVRASFAVGDDSDNETSIRV